MKVREGLNEAIPKARRNGSREAIVAAAERLFLERGFGAVSMDELASAAGVARPTLYNQFASKEEIFREMLLRVSAQLETALPSGIETQGDVEEVLRLVARMILQLPSGPEPAAPLRRSGWRRCSRCYLQRKNSQPVAQGRGIFPASNSRTE